MQTRQIGQFRISDRTMQAYGESNVFAGMGIASCVFEFDRQSFLYLGQGKMFDPIPFEQEAPMYEVKITDSGPMFARIANLDLEAQYRVTEMEHELSNIHRAALGVAVDHKCNSSAFHAVVTLRQQFEIATTR